MGTNHQIGQHVTSSVLFKCQESVSHDAEKQRETENIRRTRASFTQALQSTAPQSNLEMS